MYDVCILLLLTQPYAKLLHIIRLLGPGADILLGRLSFDHSIKVKHMTLEQLNEVTPVEGPTA